MIKNLKIAIIKDLIHYNGIERKFSYLCDTHFKIITRIMTGNIILGHIQILEIAYIF